MRGVPLVFLPLLAIDRMPASRTRQACSQPAEQQQSHTWLCVLEREVLVLKLCAIDGLAASPCAVREVAALRAEPKSRVQLSTQGSHTSFRSSFDAYLQHKSGNHAVEAAMLVSKLLASLPFALLSRAERPEVLRRCTAQSQSLSGRAACCSRLHSLLGTVLPKRPITILPAHVV